MGRIWIRTLPVALLLMVLVRATAGHAARIKDIAYFEG